MKCALVLTDHVSLESFPSHYTGLDYCDSRFIGLTISSQSDKKMCEYLQDLGANLQLCEGLMQQAFLYFQQIQKELRRGYRPKELLLFAIYHVLQMNGWGMSTVELSHFAHFNHRVLDRIEKNLRANLANEYKTSDLVVRYCALLELPYDLEKKIRECLDHVERGLFLQTYRHETRSAVVIYLCCSLSEKNNKLTIKNVAQVCAVSAGNIGKILKQFKNRLDECWALTDAAASDVINI